MCIQSAAVIVQFAVNAGKVEIQHQVTIAVICRMLPYVEVAKQGVKLVTVVRKINPPTPSGSVQLMVGRNNNCQDEYLRNSSCRMATTSYLMIHIP